MKAKFFLKFGIVFFTAVFLLFPRSANAVIINWDLYTLSYGVDYRGSGSGDNNISDTLGVDASLNYVSAVDSGFGISGDNGERLLKCYADINYNGESHYNWQEGVAMARHRFNFSLDDATPIEVSYQLSGDLSISGPDAEGSIKAEIDIYYYGGAGSFDSYLDYDFSTGQTQNISEGGSLIFDYDPNPSGAYYLLMYLETSAGWRSYEATHQESTVISNIDNFQVTFTPIPEPSTILLLGLGGLALRRKCRAK